MNVVVISVEEPLIWTAIVRNSWSLIIDLGKRDEEYRRVLIIQNGSCIIRTTIILDISRIEVELCLDMKENGSNDEKMSDIIKTWVYLLVLWRRLVYIT